MSSRVIRCDALDRSGRRARVGMIGKSSLEELPRRHDARIVLLIPKPRDGLRTDAFYRVSVEARLGERKTKQFERFVGMFHQSLQDPPIASLPALNESSIAWPAKPFLERVGIVVARAFVEESAQHLGDARSISGILRGSSLERERNRDQRNHIRFHMPCLDPARGGQRLHHRGRRGAGFNGGCHGDSHSN